MEPKISKRTVGISATETIFYYDGRERYILVRRPTRDEIEIWIDSGYAPLEAESADEIDKE